MKLFLLVTTLLMIVTNTGRTCVCYFILNQKQCVIEITIPPYSITWELDLWEIIQKLYIV